MSDESALALRAAQRDLGHLRGAMDPHRHSYAADALVHVELHRTHLVTTREVFATPSRTPKPCGTPSHPPHLPTVRMSGKLKRRHARHRKVIRHVRLVHHH